MVVQGVAKFQPIDFNFGQKEIESEPEIIWEGYPCATIVVA